VYLPLRTTVEGTDLGELSVGQVPAAARALLRSLGVDLPVEAESDQELLRMFGRLVPEGDYVMG